MQAEEKAPSFFTASVRGALSLAGYGVNTLFWWGPIFLVALVKRLLPEGTWRRGCDRLQNSLADGWIAVNIASQLLFCRRTRFVVDMPEDLDRRGWYLVMANHRSWVDILVLQRIFFRRIPFLKFFLKKELFWVPILGQAWWALDFPFMKRYSKSYLKRHPEHIGMDLDITRKACEKFKTVPISVMSFVEGTRFCEKKHGAQKSPYRNLLRPRAGGVAYVMSAMRDRIQDILDVTIVYPTPNVTFWDFLCGRISQVRVHVRKIPLSKALVGDYARDREFRIRFHQWLNTLWSRKDDRIRQMQQGTSGSFLADPSLG
jgi:1-acyl-sn-glycerol-3-phosphate acyltransferase